jgi:hypothetical protein
MNKQRRGSGRGERGGDLPRHMARFAHAGHHNPAGRRCQQINRLPETVRQPARERAQPCRFGRKHGAGNIKVGTSSGKRGDHNPQSGFDALVRVA